MTDPTKPPGIKVGQIYLEQASFTHREDALSLPANTEPKIDRLDCTIQTGLRSDSKGGFLRFQIASSPDEKDALYRISLTVVGVFEVAEERNMEMQGFLDGPAVQIILPFVREAVGNLTLRGRFGPVWLDPINPRVITDARASEQSKPDHPPESRPQAQG